MASQREDEKPGRSDGERKPARTIAVALSYERGVMEAPKVVASGHGKVAERILDIAFAHGVKVREDPDLAQLLATVDVDSFIPVEAFQAVAEILAYIYRANGQAAATPPPPRAEEEEGRG